MSGERTQITYGNEVARKGIHLASMGIPIIYLHVPHSLGLSMLAAMTIISLTVDVLMHWHAPSRAIMMKIFGRLLRDHEKRQDRFLLTGASWVLIAATATMAIFPTIIAVTAFTILIISDTFAALVGRRYGSRPFLDKSVVGTLTFILTGAAVVYSYYLIYDLPKAYVLCGCIGSVVGGVAEAGSTSLRLDDNISIPASIGIVMWLLDAVLVANGQPSWSGALP